MVNENRTDYNIFLLSVSTANLEEVEN